MTVSSSGASAGGARTLGRIVVGLFQTRSEAEYAIRDLRDAGFTNEQIGVATRDQSVSGEDRTSRDQASDQSVKREEELGKIVQETGSGMAEGASVGALTGGVIGSLVGLLGSLLVPGVGPVVVGGVLASTLIGMGVGAATGGLIGALVGMGVPEEDATYFDAAFRRGGTLVTVDAGDATPQALEIMQRHGADTGPSRRVEPIGGPARGSAGSEPFGRSSQYAGQERRARQDSSYEGPERRLVGV